MGTAKTMSDEQLADLGKDLSRMHELALSVWYPPEKPGTCTSSSTILQVLRLASRTPKVSLMQTNLTGESHLQGKGPGWSESGTSECVP